MSTLKSSQQKYAEWANENPIGSIVALTAISYFTLKLLSKLF